MKKLVGILFMGLILVGCSSDKPAEIMTCTLEQKKAGIHLKMDTEITYEGDKVTQQKQTSKIITEDEETFDIILETAKSTTSDIMEGVIYELNEDRDAFVINESITIDFSKISDEDYVKVSGDSSITLSKNVIEIDKTKEKLESQGMTCEL